MEKSPVDLTASVSTQSPPHDNPDGPWRITGQVKQANGDPAEAVVSAVDKKLSGERPLGQVSTVNGAYTINYQPLDATPPPQGCSQPDILVRAYQHDKVIASSQIIYNAGKITAVDLVVNNEAYTGPSEYTTLEHTIAPCLGDQDPAALTAENVDYLSNKTGANKEWMTWYVLAHRQSKITTAAPPLFYACYRKQLPLSLDKLVAFRPAVVSNRIASAIEDNIIDRKWQTEVNAFMGLLNQAAITSALAVDSTTKQASLGKLFRLIKIPYNSQKLLLDLYIKNKDDLSGFWNKLAAHKTLGKYADSLRQVLKVSALAQHYMPAIQAIMALPVFNKSTDVSLLAGLNPSAWSQLTKSIGKAPENIPGEGEAQLANYALLMEKTIHSAFPTQHIAANIVLNEKYERTELPVFFQYAPDFSFATSNIPVYVNGLNGTIKDKKAVISDLSRLQRLYNIAPSDDKYKVMEVLDNTGLGSSLQVRQYGKKAFINLFSKKLGSEAVASEIYARASQVNAAAVSIAMQYNDLGRSVLPYVLQPAKTVNGREQKLPLQKVTGADKHTAVAPQAAGLPDLAALFGSQSFCSCGHCSSVYGAAAYLVDMLQYLKEQPAIDQAASTPTDTVYKEDAAGLVTGLRLLFERRPEIGGIKLNCANTDTLIPYVDIVNEVLENAVLSLSAAFQTTSTFEELKAGPEHITEAAYDKLATELFPFSQPFNLWNEEAGVYMGHVGISRAHLIETFQFRGAPNEPDNRSKYAVQLNLTENGRLIITGETTINTRSYTTPDFWGAAHTRWREALSNIQTFTGKAEMSYVQLLQFLQVKYVNPDGTVKIKFLPEAPCDIAQATLAYWDIVTRSFTSDKVEGEFFEKAHRFFRLLRKTPWTIFDLGKLMGSLGTKDMNGSFIEQVAILQQVQSETGLELLELVSWWATLNTQSDENNEDDRSFYARKFLNKTVFDPAKIKDPGFVFYLNADLTELNSTGSKISDYLNEIAAALNISSSDLLLLTPTLQTTSGGVDDQLTLANLSQLFRMVSLAKAMGISVQEYLIAVRFISADPFSKSRPAELPAFLQQIEQVKQAAFSFEELQYLLLGESDSTEGIAPSEEKMITLFASLQEGLAKISAEQQVPLDVNGIPVDPTGDLVKQKLSLIIEPAGIDKVVAIVQATTSTPQNEADAATYLFFLDVRQLLHDFFTGGNFTTVESRYAYILRPLADYLVATQSRGFVVQALSNDLAIDLSTSEMLLTELVFSTDTAHPPHTVYAIDDFLDPAFAYYKVPEGAGYDLGLFVVQQDTYEILYKSALFIGKFGMNTDEAGWTFTNGPRVGWLNLNEISGSPYAVFLSWSRMENFFRMRDRFTEGDTSFFDLMDYAAGTPLPANTGYEDAVDAFLTGSSVWTAAERNFLLFLSLLSGITGWETDSLFFLASTQAYALTFKDFVDRNGQTFYQLMKCFEVLDKLGAAAEDAWTWMSIDLTAERSANIKQSAKAKYSEPAWLTVAQPLRDGLRIKQRDALTAYLIQNRGFKDKNELYEHFLLDVEMEPCMMTSRIVLANSSIQLFVQRCLMNLEDDILDMDADRWNWMKNYRIWEANRKVFLYPENWIEPELRPGKSGFFADLQNALLQNDVTADLVETTMLDYLGKMDAVSNIEVCGMYHEYEEGEIGENAIDVLHVFGKTSNVPKVYYYRTYVDNSYWTPWEKVNLDIQSVLVPIVLNRRLYLFWAEITEKKDDYHFLEIKLAYSEYKDGNWISKKITDEFLKSPQKSDSEVNMLESFLCLTERNDAYLKIIFKWIFDTAVYWEYEGAFLFYFETKKIIIENAHQTLAEYYDPVEHVIKPVDAEIHAMTFREIDGNGKLEMPNASVDEEGNYQGNINYTRLLDLTPGTFTIPIPHQYNDFVSQENFFYGDDCCNFFVKPYYAFSSESVDNPGPSATTGDMNHILTASSIEMGVFSEVLFSKEEAAGLLSGAKLPGQIPGIGKLNTFNKQDKQRTSQPAHKLASNGLIAMATNPLDLTGVNQAVNQFEYLGNRKYKFLDFYHPLVNDFIKAVNRDGVEGLLTRKMQQQVLAYFDSTYQPTENVYSGYPKREVDFSTEGSMSAYNWEIFFHIPMLIAGRLNKNQRFEEAQKWYHFIFNPTDRSPEASPNKFWQFKRFFELYGEGEDAGEDSIYNLLYALSYTGTDSEMLDKKSEVEKQVAAWEASPFDPYAIAYLRPVAFMKSVVMKYIDNLVDWGDYLFARDTIESINEATQLYVLAAQILGKRPELIPVEQTDESSYNELEGKLDAFSNGLVELENSFRNTKIFNGPATVPEDTLPANLYFCIPNNPNLLAYWDTVEDRLFKIRHCMNIEGVVRQLPLFQPPIDPALLVKAKAMGLSIGSVLNDLYAPLPNVRFRVLMQKALECCAGVKALAGALLSALEKKDAEELSLLRAGQEFKLLQLMMDAKKLQLDEARESLEALKKSRTITETRFDYYQKIEKLNSKETLHLNQLEAAQLLQSIGQGYDLAAQFSRLIPEATASVPPAATFGGANLGDALGFYGSYYRFLSSIETYKANKASINAGYERRWDEWKLLENLASRELAQIDKQITAAEIRVAIMEKELGNHTVQIENSREMSEFMTSKYTNAELYSWMSGQVSTMYFQNYQLAVDLAKKAQRCFQHELGSDQQFINAGYWDSLRKGLLAGESLDYDLKRMDAAYLDQSRRFYELTKSVSLTSWDPLALVQLRETGACIISLPEVLFDLDFPGQYMRRIKSVQVTLPCVTGPYTSVNCKLTLLKNQWRKDSSGISYTENPAGDDSRFVYNTGGTEAIALCSGNNDSGTFRLNFDDEHYLPFEGAGAISTWQLEFPSALPAMNNALLSFNYETISDVVVQMSYTAREGGVAFRDLVNASLKETLAGMVTGSGNTGLTRMISLNKEFPNLWYRFLNPPPEQAGQQITIGIDSAMFPYMFQRFNIVITKAQLILVLDDAFLGNSITVSVTPPNVSAVPATLTADAGIGGQPGVLLEPLSVSPGDWQIAIDEASIPLNLQVKADNHVRLNKEAVKSMLIILSYGI